MKKSIFVIVILFAVSTFASSPGYDLEMELSMDGKKVYSSRIITKAGTKTMVTQKSDDMEKEKTFIEVIANEGEVQGKKGIMLKFTVGFITNKGKRTVVSRPQILTRENEKTEISVGKETERENLVLSVIAQRKKI